MPDGRHCLDAALRQRLNNQRQVGIHIVQLI